MKPLVKISPILTAWRLNGKLHREDGPSVEDVFGISLWHLNGIDMSEDEHTAAVKAMKK